MKSEMKELYKKCAARIRECTAPKEVAYSFSKEEAILNDYFPDTGHSCLRESSDALPYIKIGETGGTTKRHYPDIQQCIVCYASY